MMRRLLLALAALPVLVACGDAATPVEPGERPVTGSIALSAYALDNPVVLAYGEDARVHVAPIAPSGAFRLVLDAGKKFRLVLASTQRDGSYRVVSQLTWGLAQKRWGAVPAGDVALVLGTVRPTGATVTTKSGGGSGSGSDDESRSGSDDGGSSSSHGEDESEIHESESEGCYTPGKADLPYNVRPGLGMTFRLLDAFLLKGAPPAEVLSVTMEGTPWRLGELQSGAPFEITQADCDHQGNKDIGRDRITVSWKNFDGSVETDHMDVRYCDGGGGNRGTFPVTAPGSANGSHACSPSEVKVCDAGGKSHASSCDGASLEPTEGPEVEHPSCAAPSGGSAAGSDPTGTGAADPTSASGGDPSADTGAGGAEAPAGSSTTPPGSATAAPGSSPSAAGVTTAGGTTDLGGACVVNANCKVGLACFGSVCSIPLR